MKKPASLRAALETAIPDLKRNPDRLDLWIEDGTPELRATDSESFGFSYRLNVLIEETKTDVALITLALFRWLRVNQPALLAPKATGLAFEADILDNSSADVLFRLDLTEQVIVTPQQDGSATVVYVDEPDPLFPDPIASIIGDEAPPLTEVILEEG